MIDKSGLKFNGIISPETKYMNLMSATAKMNLDFWLASLKGETFTLSGKGQSDFK